MTAPARGPFERSVPAGRFLGVPVRLHWSVLIVLVLLADLLAANALPASAPGYPTAAYVIAGALVAASFLLGLLGHELAHAVTARRFAVRPTRITLWMLGGYTELTGEPDTARQDAQIAFAGPATSLLLGGAVASCGWLAESAGAPALVVSSFGWLAQANVVLGLFNLLPGSPLDGGRLLRALIWSRTHDRARSAVVAARAGRILAMLLASLGLLEVLAGYPGGLWFLLLGWFIYSATGSVRYAEIADRLHGRSAGEVMRPLTVLAPAWWTVAEFVYSLTPAQSRTELFAVTDRTGRAVGALDWADLERVPRPLRSSTPLGAVARSGEQVLMVDAASPLAEIMLPLHLHGGTAVVLDGDRPVGTLSEAALAGIASSPLSRRSVPAGR